MNPPAPPSSFVTVMAWVCLGLGVLSLGTALLKLAMMPMMRLLMAEAMQVDPGAAGMMQALWPLLVWATLITALLSAGAVAAGVGLLRRREWGRRLFQALLLAGIVLAWAALLPLDSYLAILAAPLHAQADALGTLDVSESLAVLRLGLLITGLLLAIAVTGVHAWLMRKMASAAIRAEFT